MDFTALSYPQKIFVCFKQVCPSLRMQYTETQSDHVWHTFWREPQSLPQTLPIAWPSYTEVQGTIMNQINNNVNIRLQNVSICGNVTKFKHLNMWQG